MMCAALLRQDWEEASTIGDALDAEAGPAARLVSAALWYAEQGLRVFPLMPGCKIPFPGTRGVHEATTDADAITWWWTREPKSNVGIATGHLVDVVDYDGEQAHAAWSEQYGETWGGLTVLGTVSTPRPGGLHVYVPASGRGNRAAMVPGVDYRGSGGYVLAPPSLLDNRAGQYAGRYRFLRNLRVQGPPHE